MTAEDVETEMKQNSDQDVEAVPGNIFEYKTLHLLVILYLYLEV